LARYPLNEDSQQCDLEKLQTDRKVKGTKVKGAGRGSWGPLDKAHNFAGKGKNLRERNEKTIKQEVRKRGVEPTALA